MIDGRPGLESWKPLRMELVRQDMGKDLSVSDSPWLGSWALISRHKAAIALASEMGAQAEFLPVVCRQAELSILNPTSIIDALDEEESEIVRFHSGRVIRIPRYRFKPEAIGKRLVFKIPQLRAGPTLVTDRVVQCWKRHGLQGLRFKKLWESN